ncbi:protein ACCELERATED CELL DEATH 6 [Sorghum bicolor]|nr:protein ACCELERATED CELL DEATH 6 [Sorghum bicolor]|eukprot:XP_021305775.1 protein ACCELERATED CELL DEATH 6 [Sorghum bicolor]
MSATKALLSVNISTAYQADDQGSYPIHVAAQAGSLAVVKLLLEWCPDCANLRDGQGRTFLHVAAEKERLALVRYVVVSSSADMILNAQDSNGDTPLHAAVRAGNLAVFSCLFRNRQVRLDVANQDGMTPVDLSYTRIPPRFNYSLNPRSSVRRILLAAGAPHGGARPELFYARHIPKRDLDMEAKKHTEATQVMSIVTALIATVTFASAFTFPGGYGPDGQPVLAGSYAFDAFILADTLAFICSISATFSLVYVGFPSMDISIRFRYLRLSAILLQSAARSLVAAFGLGLYLLLVVHHTASAIAACAIVLASSLYGNMEFWGIIHMATTVLARIGMQRYAVVSYARKIFFTVLRHFWSYVIIFGLPAIRKRVNSQVDKVIT